MDRESARTSPFPLVRAALVAWTFAFIVADAFTPGPSRAEDPEDSTREIKLLEIEGVINPMSARYLARELNAADAAHAVIIRLDTPGGLETSMRAMTRDILGSKVPVVVYVSPPGARAASAGMFLTLAAHVAAMAPGTNIGAAHPVGIGGDQRESATATKVVADAAALARALAQSRGRNADWAERAVRESVSVSTDEALHENVIDLVARDLEALLDKLEGRVVVTTAGELTLRTSRARVVPSPMTLPERVLHTITDPNIAYLLFTLGLMGLAAELYAPGLLVPGITGGISLILAFVAFDALPINWAGIALLALAIGLLVAELYTEGAGFLGAGSVGAFVLGSLMLYSPGGPRSPVLPAVRVSPWLIAVVAGLLTAFLFFVLGKLLRSRKAPVVTGIQALRGQKGMALSELSPNGTVALNNQSWLASAVGEPIHAGEVVEVTDVHGITLRVTKGGSDTKDRPSDEGELP